MGYFLQKLAEEAEERDHLRGAGVGALYGAGMGAGLAGLTGATIGGTTLAAKRGVKGLQAARKTYNAAKKPYRGTKGLTIVGPNKDALKNATEGLKKARITANDRALLAENVLKHGKSVLKYGVPALVAAGALKGAIRGVRRNRDDDE